MHCNTCHHELCATRVPIFSSLDQKQLSFILSLINRKKYDKGELLLRQGEPSRNLVIVNQGKVKAFTDTVEGKEQILYIFSPGDFFGEKSLLMDEVASYHIETLEQTNVCMIQKEDFQNLIKKDSNIALKVMEELCRRLDKLEKTIETMGTKSVETRINNVLIEFAQKYGKDHEKGIIIELPLSREGIANYLGLTRETVSRKLSLLQEEGIIEMVGNKKVIIKNLHILREM